MNYIERNNFLNRLSALQRLCSDYDPNYPSALLFVPGQDGRGNKGSVTVLKYLLGSVSRELFDETLEPAYEPLEDIILLVKQNSLSVVWTHEMKRLLPLFAHIPGLIEYLSHPSEEAEIDLIQARKCCDFKRLMLGAVASGGGVGIPVPIGYDDITDIESWPILQAFALDSVYCPTGFFTARYKVADITSHLEVLFRTVDGHYVDHAVSTITRSVHPHILQTISMLSASTAAQRALVTADDVAGPLEILYDFGEMDAIGVVDAATRPVVLFGPDSAQLGAQPYPPAWRGREAGGALHVLVEGAEPSTGLRWCRTYFLARGRAAAWGPLGGGMGSLGGGGLGPGSSEPMDVEGEGKEGGEGCVDVSEVASLLRLEALYVKLLLSLRHVVGVAFGQHADVLEAGTQVQACLDTIMKGSGGAGGGAEAKKPQGVPPEAGFLTLSPWRDLGLNEAWLDLRGGESLQMHMDCVNSVGEVVTIEDVDDMGGSCWAYIRVAVCGVMGAAYGAHPSTVAVGDTFLFSSHRHLLQGALTGLGAGAGAGGELLQGDGCCVTHPLPYYRCLLGAGAEERTALRLLDATRSAHGLAALGLGRHLDTGGGSVTLSMLTDHPLLPHCEADLRAFSEGFLVERMDALPCLPMLISLGHVDRVWTVDASDAMLQVRRLCRTEPVAVAGLLVVFRLKCDSHDPPDGFPDSPTGSMHGSQDPLTPLRSPLNPLQRSMPLIGGGGNVKHIAVAVRADSRAAVALSGCLTHWRDAYRMHEVQECRGQDVLLPEGILRAYLSLLDSWSEAPTPTATTTNNTNTNTGGPLRGADSWGQLVGALRVGGVGVGGGFFTMRCVHSVSEAQRLSLLAVGEGQGAEGAEKGSWGGAEKGAGVGTGGRVVLVVGHAGSGALAVADSLAARFAEASGGSGGGAGDGGEGGGVVSAVLDFSQLHLGLQEGAKEPQAGARDVEVFIRQALEACGGAGAAVGAGEVLVLTALLCAAQYVPMHTLLAVLASLGQVTVVTVVAPASLRLETDAPEPAPEKGAKSAYMSVVQKNAAAAAAAAALAAVAAANESASAEPGGPFYNYASLPSSEGYGLGQELWSSAGGDAVAVADVAIAVDDLSSPDAYRAFKSHTQAPILRLTPSNLRVDPEAFDVILGVVRSGGGGGGSGGRGMSERRAQTLARGQLSTLRPLSPVSPHLCAYLAQQPHHPPMVDASFTVLRMRPTGPTGPTRGTWSAASVLSVLQLLLPGAKLSAAAVEDTWTAPPYKGAQGGKGGVFKRLVQLARAKVLCGRQSEEGRRVFQERIKELTGGGGGGGESGGNSPLQRLIRGMRGVHGVLLLPTGARTMVEACSSYIIARPSAMGGMGMDVGELEAEVVVQGVFGSREAALLMELFDACKSHRLLPRPPLLPSDVSFETRLRVQRGRGDRELPGGWWFDGQGYIDIQGSRCPLRPDIEVLVGEYVQQENEKIGAYNELLVDL